MDCRCLFLILEGWLSLLSNELSRIFSTVDCELFNVTLKVICMIMMGVRMFENRRSQIWFGAPL